MQHMLQQSQSLYQESGHIRIDEGHQELSVSKDEEVLPGELFKQKNIPNSRQRDSKRLSISNSNKTLMKSFPA